MRVRVLSGFLFWSQMPHELNWLQYKFMYAVFLLFFISYPDASNWMRYVERSNWSSAHNLILIEINGQLFFKSSRNINANEKLYFDLSPDYMKQVEVSLFNENKKTTQQKLTNVHKRKISIKNIGRIAKKKENMSFDSMASKRKFCWLHHPNKINKWNVSKQKIKLKTVQQEKIKYFICVVCNSKQKSTWFLKHIRSHFSNGSYDCPHCNTKFQKYSWLRFHIKNMHKNDKNICIKCNKYCKKKTQSPLHFTSDTNSKSLHDTKEIRYFVEKSIPSVVNEIKALKGISETKNQLKKKLKITSEDYQLFIYKCHECHLGFKRRGMLVNHLYRKHPNVPIQSVPELNLPILKEQKCYFCQFCDKVYKSSSKLKAHTIKYHSESINAKETKIFKHHAFSETIGKITTQPQACSWCYKQYASKTKLIQHQRAKHTLQFTEKQKSGQTFKKQNIMSIEAEAKSMSESDLCISQKSDQVFQDYNCLIEENTNVMKNVVSPVSKSTLELNYNKLTYDIQSLMQDVNRLKSGLLEVECTKNFTDCITEKYFLTNTG